MRLGKTLSGTARFTTMLAVTSVAALRAQNISTFAGSSAWGNPLTVKLDAAGNLYVPDNGNEVVYKIDSTGAFTIVAGSNKKGGFSGDGGPATTATLSNPQCATPALDGTLYICDNGNNRIRKVSNGVISTLVGGTAGFAGDGGPLSAARIDSPLDLVLDKAGNIYFSDWGNHRIRKITPDGTISTVAGFGTASFSGDGESALRAGMNPYALALAPNGNLYFTDCGVPFDPGASHRVRMVASNGIITTVAGAAGSGGDFGGGGAATAALLAFPDGVALDSVGNLYISTYNGQHVLKVSLDGTISAYAGTGTAGYSGDGGPALNARLYNPRGLTVDSANNLYIVDETNSRIRKVSAAPAITLSGVVNGASFATGGIVPGEIASIFGVNLTDATDVNLAGSLPLATTLLNVQVLVNGKAAPIFAVDNVNRQQQINFQVPFEVAGTSTATVQVIDNGLAGNTINVPVLATQPGMFTYNAGSTTYGAILHATYQLADTAHPAAAGETVLIYCTGLGAVMPTPSDGAAASGATPTAATPTVTIGGATAPVAYSGLAPGYVGLYQINVVVPGGLASGNQPVVIAIAGSQSPIATLPVQ